MADIPYIASFLTTQECGRFAAVNHQVLGTLGGLASLILDRQASDAAIQQDMDIVLAIEVEEERIERHDRFFRWCFHDDNCSCPLCDD
jgi:hypothetical protein